MVQHFGVFAGCGVLAAMVIEMTVIPARALDAAPAEAAGSRARTQGRECWTASWSRLANNLVGGRAPWIVAGGLAVLALVGSGVRVRCGSTTTSSSISGPTATCASMIGSLNATFGGTNSIQFLIQTAEPDGIKDPKVLQGMAKLQAFLESQPDVGKTQSLADLIKRMNQAMHADDPQFYAIPESRELSRSTLFLYSLSGEPQDFDNFVDNDYPARKHLGISQERQHDATPRLIARKPRRSSPRAFRRRHACRWAAACRS